MSAPCPRCRKILTVAQIAALRTQAAAAVKAAKAARKASGWRKLDRCPCGKFSRELAAKRGHKCAIKELVRGSK